VPVLATRIVIKVLLSHHGQPGVVIAKVHPHMHIWRLLFLLLAVPLPVYAQTVFAKAGNIYLQDQQGQVVQLTTSGLDSDPTISGNGRLLAFVRDTPKDVVVTAIPDYSHATELWLMDVQTRKFERLVRGHDATRSAASPAPRA